MASIKPLNMNQQLVEKLFREMLSDGFGFDLTDPNLSGTPKRLAKMYCEEFFSNHGRDILDLTVFPNDKKYSQIIMADNIHFTSICSHHFLPFSGKAWFLYIPQDNLVGLSKMSRLITHFSKRPQLQENLCHEIMNKFEEIVEPKGAMLVMRAIHGCIAERGVCQYNHSGMVTSAIYGNFELEYTRLEGMNLINLSLQDK